MSSQMVSEAGIQWLVIVFILLSGFVAAGLLNAIHQIVFPAESREDGSVTLYFDTPLASIWSVVMCLFAGPYLVLQSGLRFWSMQLIPMRVLIVCTMVAVLWSFCSGILLLQAGFSLGILQ